MDTRDEILKIEARLARVGLHPAALHRAAGIAPSTWQRWKHDRHAPHPALWQQCLAAADRLCGLTRVPVGE